MALLRFSVSYADASLSIKICAERKAGRRKRTTPPSLFFFLPFHGPLLLGTTHSRFALASMLASVASVSVRFRNKERGTRVKDRAKNGSCFLSRAAKTENPVSRSFFATKPNGNACYAGYLLAKWKVWGGSQILKWRIICLEFLRSFLRRYFGCFLRLTNCLQGFNELKTWCLLPLKHLNSAKSLKVYATCQQLNRKKSFILWHLILLERPWSPSIYTVKTLKMTSVELP